MAFRYLLVSLDNRYVGEFVVAVPDWSEGQTFMDKTGRHFRILRIDPATILGGAFHATWTVEPVEVLPDAGRSPSGRRRMGRLAY